MSGNGTSARNAIRISALSPGGVVRREVLVDLLWSGAEQELATILAEVMAKALCAEVDKHSPPGECIEVTLDPATVPFAKERKAG